MKIKLHNLLKRFDQNIVVDRINLEINDGEMFFLLGPSGCGKTTLLRILAGFLSPEEGDIFFNNQRMNDVPPQKRNTALVFQNYAVWPHLTVFENVAYGLQVRKTPKNELQHRVETALDQVKMRDLANRKPASLSGGQQQRVALARALVIEPDVLLFDEPLCNLDAKLRVQMRDEIKQLHAKNRITSVYVTHDQEEALSLASRIAVLHNGTVQQVGTPVDLYNHPANPFVASFLGEMNFYTSKSPLGRRLGVSDNSQIGFRPEHVRIAGRDRGIPAKVTVYTYLGSKNRMVLLTPDGDEIHALTTEHYHEGQEIFIDVQPQDLRMFQ